jgi:microcystin-dependent protein
MFPWGNGDGSTTFNVPNLQGRATLGRDNMQGTAAGVLTSTYYGVNPDALNALGGAQSATLGTSNLPAYTPSGSFTGTININDPGHTHTAATDGQHISIGFGGVQYFGGPQNIVNDTVTVAPATTGITASLSSGGFTGAAQGGTSTPFSNVQPSVTLDWIIKATPDAGLNNDNITVGVTTITSGSNTNIIYNNNGVVGEYAIATFADMYAGTAANKIVTPSTIWPPEVTVTYGTTTVFDMATFRDAVVTLTGNITTMTLSNVTVGKSGSITFIQDSGGMHTTVWDSKFKFAGGTTPTLTTTANAVDILNYQCRTSTFCFAAMMNDVK